ncbi:MAG: ferritin family protein [Negativicutes bacterium]|nr:ferritin family protein [Negativicutes bacterium]
MDIFEFALKMELEGEKYYRDLATKVKYAELKPVLEGLADDEQRHYKIIQAAKKEIWNYIEADPSLNNIQSIFASNKNKESILTLKKEQIDVYQAALAKEKESVELYLKLKENAVGQEAKMICEKLRHEEEKHVEVIDTIIDMLNHVNDWVEAAEFNHRDTY